MSLAAESRYLELVHRLPLRPIRDDATLGVASAMIDELLALADPSVDERDYLEVLSDLVEKYEEAEHRTGRRGGFGRCPARGGVQRAGKPTDHLASPTRKGS